MSVSSKNSLLTTQPPTPPPRHTHTANPDGGSPVQSALVLTWMTRSTRNYKLIPTRLPSAAGIHTAHTRPCRPAVGRTRRQLPILSPPSSPLEKPPPNLPASGPSSSSCRNPPSRTLLPFPQSHTNPLTSPLRCNSALKVK